MHFYEKWINEIRRKNQLLQYLLLAGSFLVLLAFMWFRMDNLLDSDIATQLVLSKFLGDEGVLLSKNWYYATELHVLGYNLVYELLFFLCDNWHIVRFLGQAILYLILLLSIYYFCKNVRLKKYYGLIATAFIIPYSEQYFLYVLKNINYVPFLAISFAAIGMVFDFHTSENRTKKITLAVLTGLLAFGAGLGGSRQLYITYAPMFLAIVSYLFLNPKRYALTTKEGIRQCPYLGYFGIVTEGLFFNLAGYLINNTILASHYDFVNYDKITWKGFQIYKFSDLIGGIFQNLGMSSEKVFSFGAVHSGVCFALVGISAYVIGRILMKKDSFRMETVMLTFFLLSSFFISIILYSFTTQEYGARYDLFWAVFVYPILMMYVGENDTNPKYMSWALSFLILGIGISTLDSYKNYSEIDKTAELKNVVSFLQEEGYENGYGTFWNASILTELSNGSLEMWDWNDGNVSYIDTTYRWAQDKAHEYKHPTGKVFLLFSEWEASNYSLPVNMGEDFVVYRSDVNLNQGILDSSKQQTKYVVYGFQNYEEMYSLIGGYHTGERTVKAGKTVKSDSYTLYPDTYRMIIQGDNLDAVTMELTYKRTVKYQHSYVREDSRTVLEPDKVEWQDNYVIVTFTIDELAQDVIAGFTNNSIEASYISSIEIKKTFGDYVDFYRNDFVENGLDDHGTRILMPGGNSYGPYRTLFPGTYTIICEGETLGELTFDCVYDLGEAEIEIENVEQTETEITYQVEVDEVISGVEFRFFNESDEEISLTSLQVMQEE